MRVLKATIAIYDSQFIIDKHSYYSFTIMIYFVFFFLALVLILTIVFSYFFAHFARAILFFNIKSFTMVIYKTFLLALFPKNFYYFNILIS